MTPQDLALITDDHAAIAIDPDGFAARFYEALFDLAPQVRSMFPTDMTDQRSKLVSELSLLVITATTMSEPTEVDALVRRLRNLGRRHVGYGATAEMYEPVGSALLTTLCEHAPGFDAAHERAWSALIGFVATTMLEGAAQPAVAAV